MKKQDMIFIGILASVLVIGYFVFQMFQGEKGQVGVYYRNQLIESININIDKTYEFEGDYGKFYLEVKDRQYHATEVECPNHDCEKVGWVKHGSAQSIVCVPNQIYVIQADQEDQFQ